jgi:AraC-like DNA-binding protein
VLAGPDTGPVVYPVERDYAATGLRLRPGVAGSVLGLPASELRDERPELSALWGRDAARLEERIALAQPSHRRELLEQAVRPLAREAEPDELVLAGLPLLGRRGSSVAELARTLAISERALRRRFNDAFGYGPKKLDRIIRFRRLLRLAALRRADGLAAAAAELGYADQAHLTREVRELSGLTPVELLAARHSVVRKVQDRRRSSNEHADHASFTTQRSDTGDRRRDGPPRLLRGARLADATRAARRLRANGDSRGRPLDLDHERGP